jgi:uncharacterized protein YaeQ
MGSPATLYRFKIELSDVDRAVYESLDLRVPMHPSETEDSLLTRVLAYALNFEEGLVFSPGISSPDEPAIHLPGTHSSIAKWIEIGNPSARRLHKASKAARSVLVYTYKDPENIKREAQGESIHRAETIEIYAFARKFLLALAGTLERDNTWTLIRTDGEIMLSARGESLNCVIPIHRLTDGVPG